MVEESQGDGDPDDQLVAKIAGGDNQALATLYRRYRVLVLNVLRSSLRRDAPELEELCHDVFLAIRAAAPGYRERGNLRSFVAGVAALKARRSGATFGLRARLMATFGSRSEPAPPPDGAVDARAELEYFLSRLPVDMREVLVLHHVEHLSAEEIAAALDIRVNTVWTRLHRAREKLHQLRLQAEGEP